MHPSALRLGRSFFDMYCAQMCGSIVHDVGAQDVNGSLREVTPAHLGYVGIDFSDGKGVDMILQDPYKLPFAESSVEIITCSSCLEHSEFFWLLFIEMLRVLKPHGLLYLNAPSNGSYHRYPVDCWRFYPDSGRALEAWAWRNGISARLTESFVARRSDDSFESGGAWNDFVAVYVKDEAHAGRYTSRILDSVKGYTNGFDSRVAGNSRPEFLSPDHTEIVRRERAILTLEGEVSTLRQRLGALAEESEVTQRSLAQLRRREADLAAQVVEERVTSGRRMAALLIRNGRLKSRAEDLRELMSQRDREVLSAKLDSNVLTSKLERLRADFDQHRTCSERRVAEGAAHIAELSRVTVELARSRDKLREEIANLQETARIRLEQVERAEEAEARLERWLSERRALHETELMEARVAIQRVLSSRSWRWSAPLRIGATILRVIWARIAALTKTGGGEEREGLPTFVSCQTPPSTTGRRQEENEVVIRDRAGGAAAGGVEDEVALVRSSGMFDEQYYRVNYPDIASIADALSHFCEHGWREGRNPSAEFDTRFYLHSYPDIRDAGVNPLLHYVTAGLLEGRTAHPATASRLVEDAMAKEIAAVRASGEFDEAFYRAMNPDLPEEADLVRHYCEEGWRQGRDPSDRFDTRGYLQAYRDIREAGINPLWHYVVAGVNECRQALPDPAATYEQDIRFGEIASDVRLLAFYATPDWTVMRGPRPPEAMEPLLPHDDLGFYEQSTAVMETQAQLAKRHGIEGFCFELIAGEAERLTLTSLECFIRSDKIEFGFCIALNMAPVPSSFQSDLIEACMRDERWIRVHGRRVILVLARGGDDLQPALDHLREWLIGRGLGDAFIVACWGNGDEQAFMAAHDAGACDAILDRPVSPAARETGHYPQARPGSVLAVPYSVVAELGVRRVGAAAGSARRILPSVSIGRHEPPKESGNALLYTRFQAAHYRRWLDAALRAARRLHDAEERFIFLQSWNDWSDGQVLEPDHRGGYVRLNETTRALVGLPPAMPMPRVSVVVPNYNHAAFLRKRLESIYAQTYQNFDVILLDDCSADESRLILEEYAKRFPDNTRTLFNSARSGSAFRQWAKGIQAATGELIWIAESDDYCDELFLERLVRRFEDESVLLAYGRSVFVDRDETVMQFSFEDYVKDLHCSGRWSSEYTCSAHDEVRTALGILNTIPNASAVVFRRPTNMLLLQQEWWLSMRVAGDWVFYLHMLRGGRIAFEPAAINYFRRYIGSTAEATYKTPAFYAEVGMACREVARLYNVPDVVLERCRAGYRTMCERRSAGTVEDFEAWFDFDAAVRARTERKPNVMISTMGFYPGGAEIFPIRLANELRRQGASVLLLSQGLSPRDAGVRRMLGRDVPVVETSDPGQVQALIKEFGIEVLNSHQWHVQKYPNHAPQVFSGLQSHVATLHGMIEHSSAFSVTEEELRTADRSVSTWVYTAEKNLVPFARANLLQQSRSRFVKIPNGIQTAAIKAVPRRDLGIPADAFVLCCVSRAIRDKGWAEAIEAVGLARDRTNRDIRLVLVGSGPVHDEYRRSGVPHFVHLTGFSQNSTGHYASADMGIMLTRFRSESLPLTIIDCLFAGKPYIATDVGDIRNMLTGEGGAAGEVVALHDWAVRVNDVANVIASFVSDSEKYRAAQSRVEGVAGRYRIEVVADSYMRLFEMRSAPQSSSDSVVEYGEDAALALGGAN